MALFQTDAAHLLISEGTEFGDKAKGEITILLEPPDHTAQKEASPSF
jgi:hypothetical protein